MDAITRQTDLTVQSATQQDNLVGIGLLINLARAGEIIAPWWSKTRDKQLRAFAKESDHFSGACWMIATKLTSIPYRVEPRDMSVKAHIKLADQYNSILANLVQFGAGWSELWFPFFEDLWTTDNGAFMEIIGEGDPGGELKGPALGLAHLDSFRCTRSSNPEFPVTYQDIDGRRYRFHHTRVVYRSQKRSASAEMNGVGLSWLSRSINMTQRLVDMSVYMQEKLGSRPKRDIIMGKGITTKQILEAVRQSEEAADNQGLRRFMKSVVIGSPTPFDIEQLDLASLPDGFDEDDATRIAMFTIALAGGFPPRWLWPATTVGGTLPDALFQHVAGAGGGLTWHLHMMRNLLSVSDHTGAMGALMPKKFLPSVLRLIFDYQDDTQDELQAGIKKTRAEKRKIDLEDGVVDIRVARQQATSVGDLTPQQFAELELEAGRLPNGDDVLTLFASTEDVFVDLLDVGVDEPLAVNENDQAAILLAIDEAILSAQRAMVAAPSAKRKERARQAIAALNALKLLYEEQGREALGEDMLGEEEPTTDELGPPQEDEATKQAVPFEDEVKAVDAFRRGVRAAIRGLWAGGLSEADFSDSMRASIRRQFRQAWQEGAAECGIKPDELTIAELQAMDNMILSQFPHLPGFANDIVAGSKANKGKLGPLLERGEMWISQYESARSRAKTMACKDKKLRWDIDPALDNCSSCLKLDKKVKRASVWEAAGVRPQNAPNASLECGGWKCGCGFTVTDERGTPGRLPGLP